MSANIKSHKFSVRKPFDCMNRADDGIISLPKEYVFTACVKTYSTNGKEVQDFFIFPDGKLFRRKLEIHGVPCDHTRFFEE